MATLCVPRRVGLGFHGFTLVEVVVVLAMIGVLAALVGTAGIHARSQARTVNCASNLANLGQSYALCTTESLGYMPLPYYNFAQSKKDEQYIALRDAATEDIGGLFGYTSLEEFRCTGDDMPASVLGCDAFGRDVQFCSSYGYNTFLTLCSINADRVGNPAQTVTFYDGDLLEVVGKAPFDLDWAAPSIRYRHDGRANFLYLDGHVEQHSNFRDVEGSFALRGVNFEGIISVNPNNSGKPTAPLDNEFQLVLPDGRIITHNEILAGVPLVGDGFADDRLEYEGPAVLLKIKPKSPGLTKQVQANGIVFDLPINIATVITGSIHVHLYNDMATKKIGKKPAMGHWWISVKGAKADIGLEPS